MYLNGRGNELDWSRIAEAIFAKGRVGQVSPVDEMLTCFSHHHFSDFITGDMICRRQLASIVLL